MSTLKEKIQDLGRFNLVKGIFYGYVLGCKEVNNEASLRGIAYKFCDEIDDSLEPETLVRSYYDFIASYKDYKRTCK